MGKGRIGWTDQMLANYEAKLGRPLKLAQTQVVLKGLEVSRPKASKFGNKKVMIDGIEFDSQHEGDRYRWLKAAVELKEIADLVVKPTFKLAPAVKLEGNKRKTPALRYEADFLYVQHGRLVVEDAKGAKTRAYLQKRHLMKTIYGIDVLET